MSADGAHLGVTPERALKTILGGEPSPAQDEQMDVAAFERWILDAPAADDNDIHSYDDAARAFAKIVLEHLRAHPDDAQLTTDGKFAEVDGEFQQTEPGIWDRVRAAHPEIAELGLTGFQVGWAVNAARHIVGQPPNPNPAIITIGE